jgi:hypothetical protein
VRCSASSRKREGRAIRPRESIVTLAMPRNIRLRLQIKALTFDGNQPTFNLIFPLFSTQTPTLDLDVNFVKDQ